MMEGESGTVHGDALRLLKNLFTYLAQPTLNNDVCWCKVPWVEDPLLQQLDWDAISLDDTTELLNNYVGLIGAQANLSTDPDNVTSPEKMIAAAKTAGYDFICFTQEITAMDADKWEILKGVCDNESTDTFKAYPGYKYTDTSGNAW